ncbi:MAG: hypothetical protein IPK00_24740 [Deltaproteobacteria bacterium]|nr:hypothetical protein [Deltaproteobacteria bacterium]
MILGSSFLTIAAPSARGGETDPTLLIVRAVASDTPNGTLVRVDGQFPWNALLQSGYPLELVVWRTTGQIEFVAFDLAGAARSGTHGALVDGLSTSEVATFAAQGQPDSGPVLTHVENGRLEAVLDARFAGAPLAAQLYVIDHGTPFVSNPAPITRGLP